MNNVIDIKSSPEAALDALLEKDVAQVVDWERSAFDEDAEPFGKSLVLFGAGNLGRRLLRCLRQDGIEPRAFADNSPSMWGSNIEGLTVFSPEEAAKRFGQRAAFVVTIWNKDQRFLDT